MTDTDRYKCNIATLSSEDLFEHRKGKRRSDGGGDGERSEIGENRERRERRRKRRGRVEEI